MARVPPLRRAVPALAPRAEGVLLRAVPRPLALHASDGPLDGTDPREGHVGDTAGDGHAWGPSTTLDPAQLLKHVRELEAALAHQRAVAEQERRRVDAKRDRSRICVPRRQGGAPTTAERGPSTT